MGRKVAQKVVGWLGFLGLSMCAMSEQSLTRAQAPFKPLRIVVIREESWPAVVNLADCTLGKMYVVDTFPTGGSPVTLPGDPVGSTLELPWRNNLEGVSRIPAGLYHGSVQADGDLGWRVKVEPVQDRTLIRIHIGNFPKQTIGCILLGRGRSSSNRCLVTDSKSARHDLMKIYGSNEERPIDILVLDH